MALLEAAHVPAGPKSTNEHRAPCQSRIIPECFQTLSEFFHVFLDLYIGAKGGEMVDFRLFSGCMG